MRIAEKMTDLGVCVFGTDWHQRRVIDVNRYFSLDTNIIEERASGFT